MVTSGFKYKMIRDRNHLNLMLKLYFEARNSIDKFNQDFLNWTCIYDFHATLGKADVQ